VVYCSSFSSRGNLVAIATRDDQKILKTLSIFWLSRQFG
jgi:hypothetical protein